MSIISKTSAQWQIDKNQVILVGDTAFETDTCRRKKGDGVTPFSQLPYELLLCPRNDTTSNWARVNPVLGGGELVFDRVCGTYKIGDGRTSYNDLKCYGGIGTDAIDILPYYGDSPSTYTYNDTDLGSGDGRVYYDYDIQNFVSIERGIGYKCWGGRYPHTLYSEDGDGIVSRFGKLYVDPANELIYIGGLTQSPMLYNRIERSLGSGNNAISQNAVTNAINNLTSKVVQAKELLPFEHIEYASITAKNEVMPADMMEYVVFSSVLKCFVAMDWENNEYWLKWQESGVYQEWDKYQMYVSYNNVYVPYPHKLYAAGTRTYMYDDDRGTFDATAPVTPIYQATGTSTSGTMSQDAVTKLFDSINHFAEKGVLGTDFASEDDLRDPGAYKYMKFRVVGGKPVGAYYYYMFVLENLMQIRLSGSGIDHRVAGGTWSRVGGYGSGTQRPSGVPVGSVFFDTTINKPIWATATGWVDANGNEL